MEPISDHACIDTFARRQRLWAKVAWASAAVLLLSIVTTARGETRLDLQLAGLVMLAVFLLASVVLCRCPRCRKVVLDSKTRTPGWAMPACPHCRAPLRAPR